MAVQVQVADFQSEPITCTVTGSAFPGLTRQMLLDKLATTEQPRQLSKGAALARSLGRSADGKGGAGDYHWGTVHVLASESPVRMHAQSYEQHCNISSFEEWLIATGH